MQTKEQTYMTDDRNKVVLTEREHFDVLHDDHFVVVLVEDSVV